MRSTVFVFVLFDIFHFLHNALKFYPCCHKWKVLNFTVEKDLGGTVQNIMIINKLNENLHVTFLQFSKWMRLGNTANTWDIKVSYF